jgi:hypothetical protein
MHFQLGTLVSLFTLTTAQHTYNVTQAFQPGNFEKYQCMYASISHPSFTTSNSDPKSTTEKVNSWLPPCLHACHHKANIADGCAYDDMACHCVNYAVYTDVTSPSSPTFPTPTLTIQQLIEPCAFPAQLGGNGTCTMADLKLARPVVADMCNFFNATLYAAYGNCSQELSKQKTLGMVALGDTIVKGPEKWNGTVKGKGWYGDKWTGPDEAETKNLTGLWWKA